MSHHLVFLKEEIGVRKVGSKHFPEFTGLSLTQFSD